MVKKCAAFFFCLLFFFILIASTASAHDDFKYFSEYTVKFKVNKWLDVFSHPEMRFRHDAGMWQSWFVRNGAITHPFSFLDLGVNYLYVRSKIFQQTGAWQTMNVIELDGTVKFPIWKFKFSSRNRIEFFAIEDNRPRQRYRNLMKLAYPMQIGKFKFTPYVSEEMYASFEGTGFDQSWVTWGVTRSWTKHLELGVYYRLESLKNRTDHFDTNHIFGTDITISF